MAYTNLRVDNFTLSDSLVFTSNNAPSEQIDYAFCQVIYIKCNILLLLTYLLTYLLNQLINLLITSFIHSFFDDLQLYHEFHVCILNETSFLKQKRS